MTSFRTRPLWADDVTVSHCTKCRSEFKFMNLKHHCRRCGLIFCNECSRSKLIVPEEDLVVRPQTWFSGTLSSADMLSDEDNFRSPQRVCDPCSFQLKDLQSDLRLLVSRANQETVVDTTSSMPSLPSTHDFYLENEIKKATAMLVCFKTTLGEEKIPRELLDIAKGVVFLTIVKAGFMFTGRYGTGLVIAKLPDDSWSAPSAVQITGMGWGLQIGAELTDVMLILSTDTAVNTFKSRAQVSVGAELAVSVGPIGRSIESDVTAGNKGAAHAFSYAQSKGLFFGASLEASGITSRPDVNRAFYGEKISPSALLSGEYPRPKGAEPLYAAIDETLASKYSNNGRNGSGNVNGHGNGNVNNNEQGNGSRSSSSSSSSSSSKTSEPLDEFGLPIDQPAKPANAIGDGKKNKKNKS